MNISPALLNLAQIFRHVAWKELLPYHGRVPPAQSGAHSDGTPVTEYDIAAQARLIEAAHMIYPGVQATGEEDICEDTNAFFQEARTKDVIIFDPIDGTGAFKRGEDTYGVMGAYVSRGETTGGIIYTPGMAASGSDGRLYAATDLMIVAEKGRGCWMYKGGRTAAAVRIDLSGRATSLAEGARIAFACRNQDKGYEDVLSEGVPGYLPRNNSSYDYTLLLTGKTDATFYSEGFMPDDGRGKCPPWDHAAGVLAVREAGGHAALPYGVEGEAYTPLFCHHRLLVAANEELFRDTLRHVKKRAPQLAAPRL